MAEAAGSGGSGGSGGTGASDGAVLRLRVFTHPACSGCSAAVRQAWEASERYPEVELRTVRLEDKEGLAEAHAEGVKTIPTVILATASEELKRWVGAPEAGAVLSTLERLTAGGRALEERSAPA